jgi:CDP-glucose 4,6-dehydratase
MADMGVASHWRGRPVLVTGAGGLLGGSVSRQLLAAGATVVGFDIDWEGPRAAIAPPGLTRADGDVRDTALVVELIGDLKVDTLIHLAAQTLVGPALNDPVDTFRNNIEGTWSILEACRGVAGVRSIVVASTDKAYGDWSGRPYREDMALRARHPYDVSKAAADLLAQSYAATYRLPIAITRCGNLYGGGDLNWSRIVPGTIRSVLEDERPVVRSDGTFVRDYLHVSDAARGVLLLAEAIRERQGLRGEAFNFAGRDRMTVLEIVRRVLVLMDSALEPSVLGLDLVEIPEQRLATAKARRQLDWHAQTPIMDGLRETISWYRANLAAVT